MRHIPVGSPFSVLDFRLAGRAPNNRWNAPGEPTPYLASDRAVAFAEFARHLQVDRSRQQTSGIVERAVFRLEVDLASVLDLREPQASEALSLRGAPACFLDRAVAQATAHYVRHTTAAQAIVVPSMAFLDHPERWIMAVFLEKLSPEPERFVTRVHAEGSFRVEL